MLFRKLLVFVLIIMLLDYAAAQDSLLRYKGPAVIQSIEGALEEFEYLYKEGAMTPHGTYYCTYSGDIDEDGSHSLFKIRSNFSKGLPDGMFEMVLYEVRFDIEHFDFEKIASSTKGESFKITGQYSSGNPTGQWYFNSRQLNGIPNATELAWDTGTRQWSYQGTDVAFEGKQNSMGYFDNQWKWRLGYPYQVDLKYQSGVMKGFQLNGNAQFESEFEFENALLLERDSIVPSSEQNRWVWDPGYSSDSPLMLAQGYLEYFLQDAFSPIVKAQDQFVDRTIFPLPRPPTTGVLFHLLNDPIRYSLLNTLEEIAHRDSILFSIMERPVFQLRRATNPICDSLLSVGEFNLERSLALSRRIEEFLYHSSRTISPSFLCFEDSLGFLSHKDFGVFLLAIEEQLEEEFELLISALNDKQEILRLRGTMEELEEEWLSLYEDLNSKFKPKKDDQLGNRLFPFLVENAFETFKLAYNQNLSLHDRKELLLEVVSYFRYYHEFFKEEEYRILENMRRDIMDGYTEYWYNPYMGTNNVEVLVKKRFVGKIVNEFWPYLLDQFLANQDHRSFQKRYEEILELRHFLLEFANHKGNDAKRLERQIIKAKDLSSIEPIIGKYLESLQSQ